MTPQEQVAEFIKTFAPHLTPGELAVVYAKLVAEEADELAVARDSGSISEVAQELADLKYVAIGVCLAVERLAVEWGIDLDAATTAVHKANMSKRAPDGSVVYREDGKVMKGPNYKPPDMTAALVGVR